MISAVKHFRYVFLLLWGITGDSVNTLPLNFISYRCCQTPCFLWAAKLFPLFFFGAFLYCSDRWPLVSFRIYFLSAPPLLCDFLPCPNALHLCLIILPLSVFSLRSSLLSALDCIRLSGRLEVVSMFLGLEFLDLRSAFCDLILFYFFYPRQFWIASPLWPNLCLKPW